MSSNIYNYFYVIGDILEVFKKSGIIDIAKGLKALIGLWK
ncbi:hypothetical protein CHUV2995_02604 [Corynebacterium diphtheriae subsp. lausannense]|nr:hypothetical protein CHUV2995_02604 [Corynebacterium diphtheriae subsp. lausannense]